MKKKKQSDYIHKAFGVEIEFEDAPLNKVAKEIRTLKLRNRVRYKGSWRNSNGTYWDIKTDSSITHYKGNLIQGGELASPKLYPGATSFKELSDVYKAINKCGATYHDTCGLHIHLDITGIDRFKFLLALLRFENELYSGFNKSRRYSEFAKPIKRLTTKQLIKPLQKKIGEFLKEDRLTNLFDDCDKYSAFYFYKRKKLNMVELRMGEANGNVDLAMKWIKMVLRIVKYSRDMDTVDILTHE